MNFQSTIACPCCGSDIHISSQLLISGASFSCSNESCDAVISLDSSSAETVKNAFDKYSELKETSIREAERDNGWGN